MSSISAERREPRMRTRTRVRLHVFDGTSGALHMGQILEAESRDFGNRGLFLSGVSLPCATRVHLYLDIPSGCIEAFGVVVHDRPQVDATGMSRQGVGIRITRLSLADEQRLETFLEDRRDAVQAALEGALARIRAERMRRISTPSRPADPPKIGIRTNALATRARGVPPALPQSA